MKKFICGMLASLFLCGFAVGCSNSGAGEKGINKEEFAKIQTGMDFFDVEGVFGGSLGEPISETVVDGVTTSTYELPGEKSGKAIFVFQYDRDKNMFGFELITKTQENLE